MAASNVFEGVDPFVVVAENSCAHAEFDVPFDAAHAFKMLAKVFNREVGAVPVDGNDEPGALPVAVFTRFNADVAASAMPLLLVVVAPICAPVARNGAIAQAVAIVVASFTTTLIPLLNAEHCPNTVAITEALFDVPAASADPPRATRYKMELLKGHAVLFAIVKAPVESVVTDELSNGDGADPLPAVPAA